MNENTKAVSVLSPVQFHNDTIYSIEHDGEQYTPVRPIVENLGMSWGNQAAKLRNDKKRWGCADISTPSNGGIQTYVCLPVRKVAAFLATINPNKVRKDLRDKVLQYQNECDDVLWDYWTKGKAINPRTRAKSEPPKSRTLTSEQLASLDQELLKKMDCWNPARHDTGREAFHRTIQNQFHVSKVEEIPEDSFDELMAFIQKKYNHPHRIGVSQDIDNHCPNVIDDFLQFMLYRVNAIMEDLANVSNSTARHNIVIELTMITSTLGAVFPEEMQWLRMGWLRDKKQVEYNVDPKAATKVAAFDQFINSDGLYTLTSAFKSLGLQPNVHIGRLREDKVLYRQDGNNIPYQQHLGKYFVVKMKRVELQGKEPKEYPQTYVTPKGLEWLRKKYCTETV